MIDEKKNYGLVGWREFIRNKDDILCEYDAAKKRNRSRPVKTSHGSAGEAAIRKWLSAFIPGKFGVTSGFIIPDIIQASDYKLYEYDVIIYDKDNSPVLWADTNSDTSDQGSKRAIPARHVKAVIEVKATFNRSNISKALKKLQELNDLRPYLPKNFVCSIIFFEYLSNEGLRTGALEALVPNETIIGYFGGVILRCDLNGDMVGLLSLANFDEIQITDEEDLPLAKDIDDIPIAANNGGVILTEQGSAVEAIVWEKRWHFVKAYITLFRNNAGGVALSWSYGNFSMFAMELIGRLEGRDIRENRLFYGQIFDRPQ
jgi:hypothetical protein